MKQNLYRIHARWRRQFVSLYLSFLIVVGKVLMRSRTHAHWIGYSRRRRRPELILFLAVYLSGIALLEPQEFAYWSCIAGGATALFLNLYMVYRFIPRKRGYWVQ